MSGTDQKDILGIEPEWKDLDDTNFIWTSLNKSRDFDTTKFGEFQYFQRTLFLTIFRQKYLSHGRLAVKKTDDFLKSLSRYETLLNHPKCGMNQQNFRLKTFRKRHPTQCRLCKCTRNEQQTSRK